MCEVSVLLCAGQGVPACGARPVAQGGRSLNLSGEGASHHPKVIKAFADCAEKQSASILLPCPGTEAETMKQQTTEYRFEATSVEGFVQQLAVNYVARGYYFYVTGVVPEGKDPWAIDRKLMTKYDVAISKWTRSRRKAAGRPNVQYLRHGRFWVLIATRGKGHPFFVEERTTLKDIREEPLKFASYAVSARWWEKRGRWVAHVGIEQGFYKELKAHLVELALRRSAQKLEREFWNLPFEPYAPVRRQVVTIWKLVNEKRKVAGFPALSQDCLRLRRKICRAFEDAQEPEAA